MRSRAQLIADIADAADALTEPYQHLERVFTTDRHRNRRLRHVHATVQPGLLQALAEAIEPGRGGDDTTAHAGGYRSVPPLCLEAVSRHAAIQIGVIRLCWTLRVEPRDSTASSIRALVGAAANADPDDQDFLLGELRTWRTWCAVMTGWQTPSFAPAAVPCPRCERVNTLRINLGRSTAMCLACDSRWDPATIGVLADHVRTARRKAA